MMLGDTADALICVQLWGRPEIVFMFPIFQFSRPFLLFFFLFHKSLSMKRMASEIALAGGAPFHVDQLKDG